MKVYIVLTTHGVEEEDHLDNVYSHRDDAETRCSRVFSLQREFGDWVSSQSPPPTWDQEIEWGAQNDVGDLIRFLDSMRDASIEEREVL